MNQNGDLVTEEGLEGVADDGRGGGLDVERLGRRDFAAAVATVEAARGPPPAQGDAGQFDQRPHARAQNQLKQTSSRSSSWTRPGPHFCLFVCLFLEGPALARH